MLKSAFCIVLALAITNVCYGHGKDLCARGSKGRITHFTPGEEYTYTLVDYPGGHGHHETYPSGTESWAYWSSGGYAVVQGGYASGVWDELDDFDDCKWDYVAPMSDVMPDYIMGGPDVMPDYVVGGPDVMPDYVAPMPDVSPVYDVPMPDVMPDYVVPAPVVKPTRVVAYSRHVEPDELLPLPPKQQYVAPIKPIVKFNLELPSGYSFQHIPILIHITSVEGLLNLLGDSVIEIYADSPDQPGGILSSAKYEEVLWASVTPGHGFIINMNEPVEIELSGVVVDIDYYLDTGWKLVGLGLDHAFDTVGDLSSSGWNNIDAIGGYGDLFYYANVRVPADEIIVPSRGDKANPATAYLVYVNNVTAAAPGVIREPLNIVTTWGKMKSQ